MKIEHGAETDWRAMALREMLRGFGDSEHLSALLYCLYDCRSELASTVIEPNRLRLMEYLREHADSVGVFYSGTQTFDTEISDETLTYTAWYSVVWHGVTVEIVYLPNYYDQGKVVLIGESAQTLADLVAASHHYSLQPQKRALLYSEGWRSSPELDGQIGQVTWNDIVLPEETLTGVREAVESWAHSRDLYAEMGFSWRRGILLVGPPGTGKTMIGKAAAATLTEMPVLYVRDLRERNHHDSLTAIFRRARELAPCLLILEDMDTLVSPINRSVLLNEMDGFKSNEGILIIASTNHPHKIDEAFLKRPSRFDRVFHIGLPAEAERAEFCRRVLARSTFAARFVPGFDFETLVAKIVEKSKGFTPAYLKEALTGAALSLAHKGRADVLDKRYTDAVLAQVDELKKTMRRLKDPAALAEMTTGDTHIGYRRGADD